jgi:GT2 family glycosyltransferase
MPSKTSIIIVNWNGQHLLKDCLPSVFDQSYSNIEVIVVDNGSEDGSTEFIETKFPDVNLIKLDKNYGFAKANNEGYRHSTGDRIALLNNDTIADSHWLENLNRSLDDYPEVGFCASKILLQHQPNIIDSAGDMLSVFGAKNRGHSDFDQPKYNFPSYVFGACAAAAIYRREMLEDIGFLDEIYITNFEDVDLSFRAQLAGYKCLYVPTAIVYHKRGETIRKVKSNIQLLSYRNRRILWLKNAPAKMVIKYLPGFILGDIYINLVNSLTNHLPKSSRQHEFKFQMNLVMFFKMLTIGNLGFYFLLPEIFKKRKEVHRKRVVTTEYIETLMRE